MEEKKISPVKAIRHFCVKECCEGHPRKADNCEETNCPLHPFRKGKNPFVQRPMSDEQKAALADRLRKAREAKNA